MCNFQKVLSEGEVCSCPLPPFCWLRGAHDSWSLHGLLEQAGSRWSSGPDTAEHRASGFLTVREELTGFYTAAKCHTHLLFTRMSRSMERSRTRSQTRTKARLRGPVSNGVGAFISNLPTAVPLEHAGIHFLSSDNS